MRVALTAPSYRLGGVEAVAVTFLCAPRWAFPVIRHCLLAPIGFFSRHLAQFAFVRFLCRLSWARLEWDHGPHNKEIAFSDAIRDATSRNFLIFAHVIPDHHHE